ncbi:MAG: DUF1819 family protein [Ignavibacteriales bacterium]|nr:hypothetical protein [Ignavibacteriaceae bacterium]QOJ30042.1 MAG: DUF1819 family protein [Ignavibacteriales bacterium]
MNINTDINLLGGLPDWNLITLFYQNTELATKSVDQIHTYTGLKTARSVTRFRKAIISTLLRFQFEEAEKLFSILLRLKGIDSDTRLYLFWNASFNNDLLHYLNSHVFFPALYSGRVSISKSETESCLRELRQSSDELRSWSEYTLTLTASKYLTLLKKFGLMEGSINKKINTIYLSDAMMAIYIYWLAAVSEMPNLLKSRWLQYSFMERESFLARITQKKFARYFSLVYTGDRLNIEPLIPSEELHEIIFKP